SAEEKATSGGSDRCFGFARLRPAQAVSYTPLRFNPTDPQARLKEIPDLMTSRQAEQPPELNRQESSAMVFIQRHQKLFCITGVALALALYLANLPGRELAFYVDESSIAYN